MTTRNYLVDLLRYVAAFGIVGEHLGLAQETQAALLLRQICDANVAIFALLSGYFFTFREVDANI